MSLARIILFLLVFTGFAPLLPAHEVPSVELEFLSLEHEWRLEGEMDIAYMLPESRNIPEGRR